MFRRERQKSNEIKYSPNIISVGIVIIPTLSVGAAKPIDKPIVCIRKLNPCPMTRVYPAIENHHFGKQSETKMVIFITKIQYMKYYCILWDYANEDGQLNKSLKKMV